MKMVTNVNIKGYDDFVKYTESIDEKGPPVYFYFSGSKLPDGNSWCPDCVVGMYIISTNGNLLINFIFFQRINYYLNYIISNQKIRVRHY